MEIDCFSQIQAKHYFPKPNDALISIATPPYLDYTPPQPCLEHWHSAPVLSLAFHDIDPTVNRSQSYRLMQLDDAKRIWDFAETFSDYSIFIHCMAGKSRSYTIAYALARYYGCSLDGVEESPLNLFIYGQMCKMAPDIIFNDCFI